MAKPSRAPAQCFGIWFSTTSTCTLHTYHSTSSMATESCCMPGHHVDSPFLPWPPKSQGSRRPQAFQRAAHYRYPTPLLPYPHSHLARLSSVFTTQTPPANIPVTDHLFLTEGTYLPGAETARDRKESKKKNQENTRPNSSSNSNATKKKKTDTRRGNRW